MPIPLGKRNLFASGRRKPVSYMLIDIDNLHILLPEENIMKLEVEGVGIEAVTPLLELMERHPMDDFGMPGAIVHFVERFYKNGYEELLIESVKRRPTMHTVWMLNRVMNGSENKNDYLKIMKEVTERSDVEEEIKNSVSEFMDR